jgi:hypothetical protein
MYRKEKERDGMHMNILKITCVLSSMHDDRMKKKNDKKKKKNIAQL